MVEDNSLFPYFLGCGVSFILALIFIVLMIVNAGGVKKIDFCSSFMQVVRTISLFLIAVIISLTSWFGSIAVIVGLFSKEWKKYNYFGNKK